MMARTLAVACILALVSYVSAAGTIEELQDTSYTQLAPVKGQWNIAVKATKTADKSVFQPQECAEDKVSAACNKPLLTADAHDKVKVTATLKAKQLKTIDDLTPSRVLVKACYAKPSTTDRPWRKANDVIDKDKSCPFIVSSAAFNESTAEGVSVDWAVPKNMTKAAWYAQVLVLCQNGTKTSFCQYDNTKNVTYFATNIINSTPKGMIIATAVCSAIGPLFLAAYFLRDSLSQRKQ